MNIKEFTEIYYPNKKEKEIFALEKFIECNVRCNEYKVIRNALARGSIRSIRDLYEIDDELIKHMRYVGDKRSREILELKAIIEHSVKG